MVGTENILGVILPHDIQNLKIVKIAVIVVLKKRNVREAQCIVDCNMFQDYQIQEMHQVHIQRFEVQESLN